MTESKKRMTSIIKRRRRRIRAIDLSFLFDCAALRTLGEKPCSKAYGEDKKPGKGAARVAEEGVREWCRHADEGKPREERRQFPNGRHEGAASSVGKDRAALLLPVAATPPAEEARDDDGDRQDVEQRPKELQENRRMVMDVKVEQRGADG